MENNQTNKAKNEIITLLGDNYKDDNSNVLDILLNRYWKIATNNSNRKKDDKVLEPYVEEAVIEAYYRRGAEGSSSRSEGSLSDSFIDIEEKLKKDAMSVRVLK